MKKNNGMPDKNFSPLGLHIKWVLQSFSSDTTFGCFIDWMTMVQLLAALRAKKKEARSRDRRPDGTNAPWVFLLVLTTRERKIDWKNLYAFFLIRHAHTEKFRFGFSFLYEYYIYLVSPTHFSYFALLLKIHLKIQKHTFSTWFDGIGECYVTCLSMLL